MAVGDAHPYPIYQCKYRFVFPLRNAADEPVSGAAGLTSQFVRDAAGLAATANLPVELAAGSGLYYLELTTPEMTSSYLIGVVRSTTAGVRPATWEFSPQKLPGITAGTMQGAANEGGVASITLAASEPGIDRYFTGCYVRIYQGAGGSFTAPEVGQARYVTSYIGAERKCWLDGPWENIPAAGAVYEILQNETALLLSRDMLANPVPGSYAAGQAGQVLGSLNGRVPAALVGSKMDAVADVTAWRGAQPAPLSGSLVQAWIAPGAIGTGAITANAIATGAFAAPKFAADFLTAAGLAADAVAEIQAGLSTLDAAGVRSALGMAAADLDSQLNTINTNVVTGYVDLQSRLPSTLDGGRMRCAVETMGVGTVTAEALADSAVDEMAGAVWDENLAAHLTPDSTGEALAAAAIGGGGGDDPWATLLPGGYAAGTAGHILGTRLDVAVSTRLATADYVLPPSVAAIQAGLATAAALAGVQTDVDLLQADVDDLQTRVPAALVNGRVDAHVGAVAAGQQIGLTPAAVDAILDEVIEGPFTLRQILRILLASQGGRVNGAATAEIRIRDALNTKDRIVAAVDEDGNRSVVTLDGT